MAVVHVPLHLRQLVDGQERIEVEAVTVQALIDELVARYPRTGDTLVSGSAGPGHPRKISRFIGIFVDGDDYRGLGGGACPLGAAARVDLLLPISGG